MRAYSEHEILETMDPAVRQRIEADREKYEPFLGMLSAWKLALEERLSSIETRVADQLAEQFFPVGDWRFPAQTLMVPGDLVAEEFSIGKLFTDPFTKKNWTPSGFGWSLPSKIVGWDIESLSYNQNVLSFQVQHEGRPGEQLITEERGQLVFVCASEEIVGRLAKADWAIQYPGLPIQSLKAARYDGYLEFEREMGAARLAQRQLEAWLPAFHPYARKVLLIFQPPNPPISEAFKEWSQSTGSDSLRLAAIIDDDTAEDIQSSAGAELLVLNAVPMIQCSVMSDNIIQTQHKVGESYKVPVVNIPDAFAASARAGDTVLRAAFARTHTDDPRSKDMVKAQNVQVTCDLSATEVRVYYGCLGDDPNPGRLRPEYLTRPQGRRYECLYPSVGGMNMGTRYQCPMHPNVVQWETGECSICRKPLETQESIANSARRYWYHSVLRPALLTEGDVIEMLFQLPACRDFFDTTHITIQLDISRDAKPEFSSWQTYLWPSLVSDEAVMQMRASYLTASRVPLIPVMILYLTPVKPGIPRFLLEDAASYIASYLSQFFMVGWYRIEAKLIEE